MGVRVEGITVPELAKSIGEFVKKATISTAYSELRESVDRDGFDNRPVVITDGAPRRAPEQVKPFGKIVFAARPEMAEVVRWALTELQKRSPVRTGRYASSHVVMINGVEVQGNIWAAVRAIKPTDKVQIVNFQPYARKLEGATANRKTGRGKRRPTSRQARAGIYRPVLRALVTRYTKTMFFDYKNVKLPSLGVKVWGDQGGGYRRDGSRRSVKRVQRDQTYPALQFFIKPTGLPN